MGILVEPIFRGSNSFMAEKISPEVLSVLRASKCDGNKLFITGGQLDRKLYEATNKVLTSLGGKWNRSAKAHIFSEDCADLVDAVVESGEYTDFKKLYQFYATPPDIADRMALMLRPEPGNIILEPSAGDGALVKAVQKFHPKALIDVFEIDTKHHPKLKVLGINVLDGDFMDGKPVLPIYDRIISNPPFHNAMDISHVRRMYDWLRPGGLIVTITSPSWQFREHKQWREFREWIETTEHTVEKLQSGTFKVSGTNVSSLLLTICKPL